MKWIKGVIEHIMRSDVSGHRLTAFFLYLLSLVYGFVLFLRRFLYRKGILKSVRLPIIVISIGNITLGGSGKTPMAIYLARLFSDNGFRPAIVSRGYKGLFEKRGGIVSDGERVLATAAEAGDEPYMMAVRTGVPVICGSDRSKAGIEAIGLGAEIIILDDGFQHLKLERDINLLLLDMEKPFGNGNVLPRGMMRERPSATKDADAFIMTRCDELLDNTNDFSEIPLFHSSHRQYVAKKSKEGITGKRAIAVSGIANNEAFAESLKKQGYEIIGTVFFEDHHDYSVKDLQIIIDKRNELSADLIVTTEKDFVKISGMIEDDSFIEVFGVEHDFGKLRNEFEDWVLSKIRYEMDRRSIGRRL